jgi:hypothetical protein
METEERAGRSPHGPTPTGEIINAWKRQQIAIPENALTKSTSSVPYSPVDDQRIPNVTVGL